MDVLFLAVGGTRRCAVVAEAAAVVEAGNRAVVVLDDRRRWRDNPFPTGVDVVALARRGWSGLLLAAERLLLFRGPRFLARLLGRGRLEGPVRSAHDAYKRVFARWFHRWLFVPLSHRVRAWERIGLIDRHVLPGAAFGTVVVADPGSMPDAVRLLALLAERGAPTPVVAYSIDHAPAAVALDIK